jgi:transcriptional regulator with XRE-family HTH domain
MAWLNGLPASVLLMCGDGWPWRGAFRAYLAWEASCGSGAIKESGVSLAKGLSQTELADALGVAFQQVQKYEKGTNRVGSGRLLKISAILGVKITDFFEGTDRPHDTARRSVFDQLAQPESFRLVQAFSGIDRPNIRPTLVRLIEQIAAEK